MNKIQELQKQFKQDLDSANGTFEKNLIKAEYEHRIKLLGLKEEINLNATSQDSDFECIGCGA